MTTVVSATEVKAQLLIFDEHALVRVFIGRLLSSVSNLNVVAECSSAADALQTLSQQHIDLVLLDQTQAREEDGFRFIRHLRSSGYTCRILILTAGMADEAYVQAIGCGANGIFLTHNTPEVLTDVIQRVIVGETWFDPRCVQALAAAVQRETSGRSERPLTDRERTVLRFVSEGMTNKEISSRLEISSTAVKAAMRRLFFKTGARTRSQLVRVALKGAESDS